MDNPDDYVPIPCPRGKIKAVGNGAHGKNTE